MGDFTKQIVETELAPSAVGTYSQGVSFNGVHYFSGQIGLEPKSGQLADGFEAQTDQILKNIDGLLTSQNISREHILKTTIFVTNLENFSKVNQAYESYFSKPYPARSCVEVPALPKNALIEIEVMAAQK